MNLFSIVRPRNCLILVKKAGAYRSQVVVLEIVAAAAFIVLIGWALASRIHSGYLAGAGVLLLILLALAVRAYELQRMAGRDESVCFDKEHDSILRNGQSLAAISDVDHILVRRIVPENDNSAVTMDCALVVSLRDSRKITVAEVVGLPGGPAEVEKAAREIAEYAGVPVQEGTRRESEYWMDMS